jgi:signal transduction histidine kinase
MAVSEDAATVRVAVFDTGCGIPATHLPYLFDRFYRADRARSNISGGLGLGLAIVKSIATLHGGSVEITSEVGRGTCVTLRFPRQMTNS